MGDLFRFKIDAGLSENQDRTVAPQVRVVGPICKFCENLMRLSILAFLLIPEYNILPLLFHFL